MSEIPAKPSTTKESGNNTQSGTISIPDINFSINCNVNVNIDPETKNLLMAALRLLDGQNRVINRSSSGQIINSNIQSDTLENLIDDEPLELSVNIPEEVIEPAVEKPYGTIIFADQIEWNKVSEYPLLDWREENSKLILRYANLSLDTNWSTIHRLREFTGPKRRQEIEKTVGSKTHKKITAFSIFCRLVDEGAIKAPPLDKNLMKMMVTPYISTAPNPDCGNIEGTLEG